MLFREFLDKIADLFGRKNWADFSMDENTALRDLFDDIDSDAYTRGFEKHLDEWEADMEESYDNGWNDGYDEGYNDARSSEVIEPHSDCDTSA